LLKIFNISLYQIIRLNHISIIKKNICIKFSKLSLTAFFQSILENSELIEINKNLHQSRAGIGNRLNTQRLIEIIAHIITINITQDFSELATKSTIHIGPFIF
jgi:hypothetical protein